MSSENNPYGHLPIEELGGLTEERLAFFAEHEITHGSWIDEASGEMAVSRFIKRG